MPEPRIPDVDDDIRKSGIPDVDDNTPLIPAKGKRKSGIPVVDYDTPLFPAMKALQGGAEKYFRKTIHTTHEGKVGAVGLRKIQKTTLWTCCRLSFIFK